MSEFLCINIRFLDPASAFHGQRDDSQPEWPPSPLRLFQSLVDSAASQWRESQFIDWAKPMLTWIEMIPPVLIVTPTYHFGIPFQIAVPNNDWDSPAHVWARGSEPIKPHRPIDLKTMKTILSTRLDYTNQHCDAIQYLYLLPDGQCPYLDILTSAARSITHLGWGVDMAVGDASIITREQVAALPGLRWRPSPLGGVPLRTPKPGTLDDLIRKHTDFLNRVSKDGFRPVPPLRVFDVIQYRCQNQPLQRPCRIFELRNTNGSRFRYPHRKLIHIAGMVRHLAIEAMRLPGNRPSGVDEDWAETYIAGHINNGNRSNHRQLSYIPLPSVGHEYADPGVRRVMISAPVGDEEWLDQITRRLAGTALRPDPIKGVEFGGDEPPILVPMPPKGDGVTRCYTSEANEWASVTPVILPGFDDHKPGKTQKLIEKVLFQSGIEQACDFEWSTFSRFRKSYSSHKYGKDGKPAGYFRPDHLLTQTAVHLTLRFKDGLKVPGPIAIGAGRHCGFGIFASLHNM